VKNQTCVYYSLKDGNSLGNYYLFIKFFFFALGPLQPQKFQRTVTQITFEQVIDITRLKRLWPSAVFYATVLQ
jgi:hypothetical protein